MTQCAAPTPLTFLKWTEIRLMVSFQAEDLQLWAAVCLRQFGLAALQPLEGEVLPGLGFVIDALEE